MGSCVARGETTEPGYSGFRVGPHVQDWRRSISYAYLAAGIGLHVRCAELIVTTFANCQYAMAGSPRQSHNPRRDARASMCTRMCGMRIYPLEKETRAR